MLDVRGIGRVDFDRLRLPAAPGERWRPHTTGLVTGLYGYRIPLAFRLVGGPEGIRVQIGTWSTRANAATQDRRRDVIRSVLGGLYASITIEDADDETADWPLSGLALGIPAPIGIQVEDESAPVDRIVASLGGSSWSALVLAYPVAENVVAAVRQQVLNEMRTVEARAASEGAPSPLAEDYVELLKHSLRSLGDALATGGWRTAVYLLGDGESYPRLVSAWRSVFSGKDSLPEPVRIFDLPDAAGLAASWALPDDPGGPPPGTYCRPFEFQTLLTTAELAAYVHLPELETPGFSVERVARFDAVRPSAADGVSVGRILHRRLETSSEYRVSLSSLTRHAFVAGVTGAGKTNTLFALLAEVAAAGVPFLVVEPTKAEYRALLDHPALGKRIRVFTAGRAQVAPLLLNPFEVPVGTTVSEHLDLLRAAFATSFGMWTPLPQVLERCLHDVYTDRGWDLRTNANARLNGGEPPWAAYPTLSDLVDKVDEVVPKLGYEERVAADISAALATRLDSLRRGGKGAMLDVARSLPFDDLLSEPTVLELEGMGDDDDKAFLMGLLVLRLAEYRRTAGQRGDLVHLLVLEEAHRLLENVSTQRSEEAANPRGQAVEAFTNLLSEIRAYGQGVVLADQVPVRLAPDVIKNTALKVAHRIVAADDRVALGATMALDENESRWLTTLRTGEAAVFADGDDAPVLVRVPLAKGAGVLEPPADARVAEEMSAWRESDGRSAYFLARPFCAETCAGAPGACEEARRLIGDDYVQRVIGRVVLSTIEDAGSLDRQWPDVVNALRARRPTGVEEEPVLRAFAGHAADWYASRRGSQGQWSYADTESLAEQLRGVLLEKVAHAAADGSKSKLRRSFQSAARRLHRRTYPPYYACDTICVDEPPQCLYRSAVADLVASGRYQAAWRAADAADATSADRRRRETWQICQDAGYELIEFPEEDASAELRERLAAAARRTCLCFEQQMLADDERKVPRTSRNVIVRVIAEATGT